MNEHSTAQALQVAREWQEVLTILLADTATNLELDMQIELKEKRGHPFWWGKVSVLRTLKEMADKDVERFTDGASILDQIEALKADNAALLEALRVTQDALVVYFNKRGVDHSMRKGNEDIGALADALSDYGPMSAADHPGEQLLAELRELRCAKSEEV